VAANELGYTGGFPEPSEQSMVIKLGGGVHQFEMPRPPHRFTNLLENSPIGTQTRHR